MQNGDQWGGVEEELASSLMGGWTKKHCSFGPLTSHCLSLLQRGCQMRGRGFSVPELGLR